MRSRTAILVCVQFHITGPSPHSVILCGSVSVFLQWAQLSVSARWIAASRSLVGTISCMTAYHVDCRWSDIGAWCKLLHTRAQEVVGCFSVMGISGVPRSAMVIAYSTPYIRFLNVIRDSDFPGECMYGISMAQCLIYAIFFEILFPSGGFARVPDSVHFRIHAAVTDPSRTLSIHERLRRSVLHFTAMSGSAQPPCSFARWSVVAGTRNVVLCHMYQAHSVVNFCVCARSGGSI